MERKTKNSSEIAITIRLNGKFAEVFRMIANQQPGEANTVTLRRILRGLPEYKQLVKNAN